MSCIDVAFTQTYEFISNNKISISITAQDSLFSIIQLRLRTCDNRHIIKIAGEDWFNYAVMSSPTTTFLFDIPRNVGYIDTRLQKCDTVINGIIPVFNPNLSPFIGGDEPPCANIATSIEEECYMDPIGLVNAFRRPTDSHVVTEYNPITIPKKINLKITHDKCSGVQALLCSVRCPPTLEPFAESPTPTPTVTKSPTPTVTRTCTPTVTTTPTTTPTITPTITVTPTASHTPGITNTPTPTITNTSTVTPTITPTATTTKTTTPTPTKTPTTTPTPTPTKISTDLCAVPIPIGIGASVDLDTFSPELSQGSTGAPIDFDFVYTCTPSWGWGGVIDNSNNLALPLSAGPVEAYFSKWPGTWPFVKIGNTMQGYNIDSYPDYQHIKLGSFANMGALKNWVRNNFRFYGVSPSSGNELRLGAATITKFKFNNRNIAVVERSNHELPVNTQVRFSSPSSIPNININDTYYTLGNPVLVGNITLLDTDGVADTRIEKTNHGLVAGDKVMLGTTGSLPKGLTTWTVYTVCDGLGPNRFRVTSSNLSSGPPVSAVGSHTGTHSMIKFVSTNPNKFAIRIGSINGPAATIEDSLSDTVSYTISKITGTASGFVISQVWPYNDLYVYDTRNTSSAGVIYALVVPC